MPKRGARSLAAWCQHLLNPLKETQRGVGPEYWIQFSTCFAGFAKKLQNTKIKQFNFHWLCMLQAKTIGKYPDNGLIFLESLAVGYVSNMSGE